MNTATTSHGPRDTYIGKAPSGVDWWCYRDDSDSDKEHESACATMRLALAELSYGRRVS